MKARGFRKALIEISKKVKRKPEMSEGSVQSIFAQVNPFTYLGYKDFGIDIKSQEKIKKGKVPDFECLDDFEQSIFVLELKKPKDEEVRKLESYKEEIFQKYVKPKRSKYGALSNGIKFILYKRIGESLIEEIRVNDLEAITEEEALVIYQRLKKPSYDYTNLEEIIEKLKGIEPKPLSEEDNRESFYEIFKLKQEETGLPTKFTRLVYTLMYLFDELISGEEKSEFLEGAYRFWKRSYAHKPSKIPESWKKLKMLENVEKDEELLYKFMFCLETAHNIVAKLILAKVCEDVGLKNVSMLKKLEAYMNLKFSDKRINLIAYPFAIKEVFDSLRSYLVESVFEDDIFDWWTDIKLIVGESISDWRTRSNFYVESFGEALAKIFFALQSFDFRGVKEDILGELYQHYFDPETRKALGEFYTPIEVVEYILDAVDYKGQKILNQRLLDPACGSGTFIVQALKRYLKEAEKRIEKIGDEEEWARVLRDLCEKPKIIGFDINPFARLMAQIRFMMEIIPYYIKAQKASPDFVLTSIPIFRTDSLEIETKTGRFQKQLGEFAGDIKFFMRLPVISKEKEEFIPISFNIPAWEKVKDKLGKKEFYYLMLKQTFKVIKDSERRGKYELDKEELKRAFLILFAEEEAEEMASLMLDYANVILGQIYILRKEYSDGRLVKTLEDLVLAGILKNYFKYDYVVGNPPYVRVQLLPRDKREYYSKNYNTPTANYDIYVVFIERGLQWLVSRGKLGYITSNQFIFANYGKKLREHLLNYRIDQIIDFTDTGVFKDVTNYPCILILSNQSPESNVIKCVKVFNPREELLESIRNNFGKQSYVNAYYELFNFPQEKLDEDWRFIPPQEQKVFDNISQTGIPLKNFTRKIFVGLQTSADQIYLVKINKELDKNLVVVSQLNSNKRFKLEKKILKPLLKGKDIRRWSINWHNIFLIFPYYIKSGKVILYPKEKLEMEFPFTWKYFKKHETKLKDREKGRMKDRADWYGYIYRKNLDKFERIKLLVRVLANQNTLALDTEGFYFVGAGGSNAYGVILKKKYDNIFWYKYFLGLLNSKILEFYLKHISPIYSGKYYIYGQQYLERLPIKLPKTKEEKRLAKEITQRVEKILELAKLEQKIENFPESYFEELKDEIEEWDEIKWKPIRNYKEVKIKVEKDLNGEISLIFGKNDSLTEPAINSDVKVEYIIEALKGKKVKKGEEIKIKLPTSDEMVRKILKKFEKDKEMLKDNPIAKLEEEINERVYKLYGLNGEDIKVIEEFLERF